MRGDLAAPAAGAARDRLRAGLAAVAAAHLAAHQALQLERLVAAARRLEEADGHLDLHVVALLDARATAAAAAAREAEAAEHVGEVRQDVLDAAEALEAGLARSRVAVLVVQLALLRVGQYLVGLGQLLEAIFRSEVAGVAVGMVLHRQALESLPDFTGRGVTFNPQHFVIVALFVHINRIQANPRSGVRQQSDCGSIRDMSKPLAFLKRLFSRDGDQGDDVIQMFTPQIASERSTGTKIALAGATVLALAGAGAVAFGALLMLFVAVGAIYFLLTQVLGIRLDVDPRAFVQRAQEYAQHSRNN